LVKVIKDETGCGNTAAYDLIDKAFKKRFLAFNKITRTYEKRATR
jgi:hypothetical protein